MITQWILIAFLAIALFLYLLWGGADFGAGILETFSAGPMHEKQKAILTRAIGPVWEANHIWLIVVVVILFNGFPDMFYALSIQWHIPMVALLMGIVLRGSAFAFRYYGVYGNSSGALYTFLYRFGSWFTPLVLGIIGGSLIASAAPQGVGFYALYVAPWFNAISFSVGLFLVGLCAWVSAVYVFGESQEKKIQDRFFMMARYAAGVTVLSGGLVFVLSFLHQPVFFKQFLTSPIALACVVVATVFFVPLVYVLRKRLVWWPRVLVSAQLGVILLGWGCVQWKKGIVTQLGTFHLVTAGAPAVTQRYLVVALTVGISIIFPSLFYLFRIFKTPQHGSDKD